MCKPQSTKLLSEIRIVTDADTIIGGAVGVNDRYLFMHSHRTYQHLQSYSYKVVRISDKILLDHYAFLGREWNTCSFVPRRIFCDALDKTRVHITHVGRCRKLVW